MACGDGDVGAVERVVQGGFEEEGVVEGRGVGVQLIWVFGWFWGGRRWLGVGRRGGILWGFVGGGVLGGCCRILGFGCRGFGSRCFRGVGLRCIFWCMVQGWRMGGVWVRNQSVSNRGCVYQVLRG